MKKHHLGSKWMGGRILWEQAETDVFGICGPLTRHGPLTKDLKWWQLSVSVNCCEYIVQHYQTFIVFLQMTGRKIKVSTPLYKSRFAPTACLCLISKWKLKSDHHRFSTIMLNSSHCWYWLTNYCNKLDRTNPTIFKLNLLNHSWPCAGCWSFELSLGLNWCCCFNRVIFILSWYHGCSTYPPQAWETHPNLTNVYL